MPKHRACKAAFRLFCGDGIYLLLPKLMSGINQSYIKHLCRGMYLQLRKLGPIRHYFLFDSAKKVAVAFILSRLDYCNALLMGIPDEKVNKLQRIQNSAARV